MGKWRGHGNNCWALYSLHHLIFKTAQCGWEIVFWFYRRENRAEATWSEVKSPSRVWFFVTPWTIACQAPLPVEFSREEYWSGLPFPSPRDLPDPGIKPGSPALTGRFFTTAPPGKPPYSLLSRKYYTVVKVALILERGQPILIREFNFSHSPRAICETFFPFVWQR